MTKTEEEKKPRGSRADYHRSYRTKVRGGPPRKPKPCGTVAAARRHQRAKEPLCGACAPVWAQHQERMYMQRKAKKATI